MKDVMLDLETWGTRPGCAIRSVGAVFFGYSGPSGPEFYRNVSRASCEAFRLHIDPDTEAWWSKQSATAQAALLPDQAALYDALMEFDTWFRMNGGERVWCHGANFDAPILEAAAKACEAPVPWKFWNVRCTRTLYAAAEIDDKKPQRRGVHHNALDDAKFQAECVQMAARRLRLAPPEPPPVPKNEGIFA